MTGFLPIFLMILAGITVYIIERDFRQAAFWSLGAALLSWVGLMHSYDWTVADTVIKLGWGAGGAWAVGYVLLAILFFYAAFSKRHEKGDSHSETISEPHIPLPEDLSQG